MKAIFAPRRAGKSFDKLRAAIKTAIDAGIPRLQIKWRLDHGWPLDKLAAKTLEEL
jgi:hypothetical protein